MIDYLTSKKWLLALTAVTAAGFLLRVYELGHQSLWIDEIFTINGALSAVENILPLMESGSYYTNNFVPVYISALIIKFFGLNAFDPWLLRLPAVIFGTLLIPASYILARRLFQSLMPAILSSVFIAFSYHEIAWSRQVRGYSAAAFFAVVMIIYLWNISNGSRTFRNYCGLGISFVLAFLSHWVAGVFLPAILLVIIFPKLFSSYEKFKPHVFLLTLIVLPMFLIAVNSVRGLLFRYLFFPFVPLIVVLISGIVSAGIQYFLRRQSAIVRCGILVCSFLLVSFNFMSLYPRREYDFKVVSPQPDFRSVFEIIREQKKDGDAVISRFPAAHKIYLGDAGFWLPIVPTEEDQVEFYTGATAIRTLEELKKVTNEQHGFIIFDIRSQNANLNRMHYIVDNPRIKLEFYGPGERPEDRIWLYRF